MRTPEPWPLPLQPTSRTDLGRVSDEMVSTQLRRGALLRLRRGVYVAAGAWPDDPAEQHLLLARAEVAACADAVLCRQSAAVAWGLPSPDLRPWHVRPVAVALPADSGYRTRTTAAEYHALRLRTCDVERDAAGYRVTSLARTAVDLAAGLPLPEALVILDAVTRQLCARLVPTPRRRDFTNPRLVGAAREVVADAARAAHRTGLLPAIAVAEPCRESPAESLSAGHFRLAGLPVPVCQAALRTPAGLRFPDFYWDEHRLIGECDGAVKYAEGSAAYLEEKVREQLFLDLDFGVVRWLAKEIYVRPGEVVARVARRMGL
ncbi:MAG: hypothetical protein QM779_12515 [Propionicimonas sp.]|uniref:hypothetical protein n=1 Tax=Propionicimonas sp. TaxID=1955623 RepID=UPI003D0C467D